MTRARDWHLPQPGARRAARLAMAGLAALVLLASCTREEMLEGERLDLRTPLVEGAAPGPADTGNTARPISLPAQVNHAEWSHRNGSPQHLIQHPALGQRLVLTWSAPIGAGDDRRERLAADPVASGGRIFTLDARGVAVATSTRGGTLWTRDLAPPTDRGEGASGGGLAVAEGRLFVTTAFGELVVLDPTTGAEIWRQDFDAPVTGTPTVSGDRVFVVARNGTAWALRVADGKVLWQIAGTPEPAGMLGTSGPALAGDLVILPFASGELLGVTRDTGRQVWTSLVAGKRVGRPYVRITDIAADPVVQGNTFFVGTGAGRLEARDVALGEPIWTAREGAMGPVWPAGGSLFLVSDAGELVRLDSATGARVWGVPLPYYDTEKVRRQKTIYGNFGPVLAGGRLIVASGDGQLRSFDPASGALVASVPLPGGAASNPVVVGGVLYVVSATGNLLAFR